MSYISRTVNWNYDTLIMKLVCTYLVSEKKIICVLIRTFLSTFQNLLPKNESDSVTCAQTRRF